MILIGCLGFYLGNRSKRVNTDKKYESTLDSLALLRKAYESRVDSLFLLRAECDSLTKTKIREVTEYKFIESVQYLEKEAPELGAIETEVRGDTDSVAILGNTELRVINGKLTELSGLRQKDSINTVIIETKDSIINVLDTTVAVKDSVILQKDQVIKDTKKKSRKKAWYSFGIGSAVGAGIVLLLWML